jgi:hypothetical protein
MCPLGDNDFPPLSQGTVGQPTLSWPKIETSQNNWSFGFFDAIVNQAKAAGLVDSDNVANMVLVFGETPQWAASDTATCKNEGGEMECTSPPSNIQYWQDFVAQVIQHYNGVRMPHIKYYELWLEANGGWSGSQAELVQLAQAAYPIIHTDPYSMLMTPSVTGAITGSGAQNEVQWMGQYLAAGGAQYADGVDFHSFMDSKVTPHPMPETQYCTASTTCFGPVQTLAAEMRNTMNQYGMSSKPLLDTSGSWGAGGFGYSGTEETDTESAYVARWMLLHAGLAATLNLQLASWYAWGSPSNNTWGVLELTDGSKNPNTAGLAWNQVYNWTAGATMAQPCAALADNTTWTCSLTRSGGYSGLAVWSTSTSGGLTYTPATQYTQYRDLTGATQQITPGATVSIGIKPILLESVSSVSLRRRPRR